MAKWAKRRRSSGRTKDACSATTDAMYVVVDSHLPVGITAIHPPRIQHPPEARQSLASRSQVAGFGCFPRAKVPSSTGTDYRERETFGAETNKMRVMGRDSGMGLAPARGSAPGWVANLDVRARQQARRKGRREAPALSPYAEILRLSRGHGGGPGEREKPEGRNTSEGRKTWQEDLVS
ncbi:hypothetical protein CPLU01_12199 [Colletotrichum plurivorum]|uniref:Uncharacterized protein n=1 Tax=Colletotrichum plurivorum TaxID=2175906 RepID=A0A8H6K0F9_9PEZI|nr:hypothetical protein CPLU01_12199 [Colletotrichum plurivorum]